MVRIKKCKLKTLRWAWLWPEVFKPKVRLEFRPEARASRKSSPRRKFKASITKTFLCYYFLWEQ